MEYAVNPCLMKSKRSSCHYVNCFKDNRLVLILTTALVWSAEVKLPLSKIRQYLAPAYILRTLSPVDFKA